MSYARPFRQLAENCPQSAGRNVPARSISSDTHKEAVTIASDKHLSQIDPTGQPEGSRIAKIGDSFVSSLNANCQEVEWLRKTRTCLVEMEARYFQTTGFGRPESSINHQRDQSQVADGIWLRGTAGNEQQFDFFPG